MSAAQAVQQRAYAPYSKFRVGCALEAEDGTIFVGCNVENASYGLGLCAECTLVGQLRLTGGGRLVALACRSGTGELLMPCGRCRQLLYEHGGPDCLIDGDGTRRTLAEILPIPFGPDRIAESS